MTTPQRLRILALVSELFFIPRIQGVAKHLGYDIHFVEQAIEEEQFMYLIKEHEPNLLIVDTNNQLVSWAEWVAALKADSKTQKIPVLAFGSHKDLETIKKAKQAGADAVVARSRFTAELPELIHKYITPAQDA